MCPGKDLGMEFNVGVNLRPTPHHVCDLLLATSLPYASASSWDDNGIVKIEKDTVYNV